MRNRGRKWKKSWKNGASIFSAIRQPAVVDPFKIPLANKKMAGKSIYYLRLHDIVAVTLEAHSSLQGWNLCGRILFSKRH